MVNLTKDTKDFYFKYVGKKPDVIEEALKSQKQEVIDELLDYIKCNRDRLHLRISLGG